MKYIKSTQINKALGNLADARQYLRAVKAICSSSSSPDSVLTEAELIQIANHVPTQQVEVHLVI